MRTTVPQTRGRELKDRATISLPAQRRRPVELAVRGQGQGSRRFCAIRTRRSTAEAIQNGEITRRADPICRP